MLIAMVASFLWALGWLLYDARWTSKGIAAGVGVEGNWLIVKLAGTNKPNIVECLLVDVPIRCALFGIGFVPGPTDYPASFQMLATAMLFTAGVKNIRGGRQWKWLLSHRGETIPPDDTIWQKIIGFWG